MKKPTNGKRGPGSLQRMERRKISKQSVRSRVEKSDGCWKQYPIGCEVLMLETGISGNIIAKLDDSITGYALYLVSGWDGVSHRVIRSLLKRVKST